MWRLLQFWAKESGKLDTRKRARTMGSIKEMQMLWQKPGVYIKPKYFDIEVCKELPNNCFLSTSMTYSYEYALIFEQKLCHLFQKDWNFVKKSIHIQIIALTNSCTVVIWTYRLQYCRTFGCTPFQVHSYIPWIISLVYSTFNIFVKSNLVGGCTIPQCGNSAFSTVL